MKINMIYLIAQEVQKARQNVKRKRFFFVASKNRFNELYRDRIYERYRHGNLRG